ncbi:MAG: outer membrane beta-barrel protein [Xanthobacteraceae bacterium]
MRKLLIAGMMFGAMQGAQAADLPILRGALPDTYGPQVVNWEGVYIGGHAAVGESDMNFKGATQDVAAHLLAYSAIEAAAGVSSWPVGSKASARGDGFGGFIGYNSQWDDVVLGVEANYLHGKFGGTQTESMGRSFVDGHGYSDDITYTSTATMRLTDIGTFRGRAGYAFGAFLPYMFGGLALGQADIVRTASITGSQRKPGATIDYIPVDLSKTEGKYSHLVYGYTAGLGVDVNLMAGLFLRAEWEYIRFTAPIDTAVNTVRAGIGYKF